LREAGACAPDRERRKRGDGGQYFRNHPVGGGEIIRADEFVEGIYGYDPGCERRAAALASRVDDYNR
jgi:hypothetical protein